VLYRSTDRLCRRGACVKNLSHSASLQAGENNAPSNAETKHLGRSDDLRNGIPKGAQIRFNADFWRSAVDCDALRDDPWERLQAFAPGGRKGKRGPRTHNRRFLNALLWMARSGGRWRDLPRRFGKHESVKRRYYRWIEMGVLDAILAALAREADLEWLMIDSTIVRAHQQAAGARRQKGGECPGPWPLPRRLEHQNPRRRRCAGQSGAAHRLAWTAQRHRFRARVDRRLRPSRHNRRQGLRR
jgi:transposase